MQGARRGLGAAPDAVRARAARGVNAQDSDWKQFVSKIEHIDNRAETRRLQREAEKRRFEARRVLNPGGDFDYKYVVNNDVFVIACYKGWLGVVK